MTTLGIINLASILYLSAAISFAFSLNENREPARIVREALRRWLKFLLMTLVIGVVVFLVDR